ASYGIVESNSVPFASTSVVGGDDLDAAARGIPASDEGRRAVDVVDVVMGVDHRRDRLVRHLAQAPLGDDDVAEATVGGVEVPDLVGPDLDRLFLEEPGVVDEVLGGRERHLVLGRPRRRLAGGRRSGTERRAILTDHEGWFGSAAPEFQQAVLSRCVWREIRAGQPIYSASDVQTGPCGI